MKQHIILGITFCLALISQGQNTKFSISGKLLNTHEPQKVYLQVLDPNTDSFVSIDSVLSKDSQFRFTKELDQKALGSLTIEQNQNIFILEPANLKAELDVQNPSLNQISGTLDNQQLSQILNRLYTDKVKLEQYMKVQGAVFEKAVDQNDYKVIDSIKTDFETKWNTYISQIKSTVNNQIQNYPNQFSSMFLVYLQLQGQNMGQSTAVSFYENLSPENKQTNLGQLLKHYLEQQNQQNIIAVGEIAPLFKADLLQGESFDLQNELPDLTLIHFWASWCEGCSERLSNLQRFYNSNKNIEIISVSVDLQGFELEQYVQQNNMPWKHATNQDELIELFGPTTIPTTYVIDQNGIIKYINHINENDILTMENYLKNNKQ